MINSRRKNQIKGLAEFLALEYDRTVTPLDQIAAEEEVSIFCDNYENAFDGALVYDDKFYIHLNTNLGNGLEKVKGRFTLAHELGHYFIDSHREALKQGLIEPHPSRYNKNKHLVIEREADFFASCLLMPETRFRISCKQFHTFDFQVISDLAKTYHVSLTACAIRFADIGTHPICIVYMENNKVEWRWSSQEMQFFKFADGKQIPADSLAGQYFRGKRNAEPLTKRLWFIDWFEDKFNERLSESIFEHCIPYQNKALSVIWMK